TARNLLIAGEVAVSLVLVTGAGLMIRGILRLESTHPGFNPDNLMLVGIAPIPEKYPRPIQKINYYRQVLERVQTLPGVRSAGAQHPGIEAPWSFGVEVEGRPLADPSQAVIVRHRMVDPNFFATTGIPLIQGRLFGAFDGPEAPKVAVISQSAARSLFPGEDPIGRRIRDQRLSTFPWMTVIGVVGDVRYYNAEPELRPSLYRSYLQFPPVWLELIVRADNPSQLFRSLSREIWALDSEQSIEGPETVQDVISRVTSPSKFLAKLLAAFAGLSLALAALGIYSVTAYLASQRVRELGIRVALGALPGHLFRLVLGDTFKAALAGVVAGLLASSSLSRLLEGHLHGVLPYDLLTLGAVSLLMLAVALLAAWAPASRARRVDPASVLRYE
ncbi:MAG: FtsX-like permease family protein, partial [Acidobacteria bacterium]|nr:FtsX-like permease family protein [Acidobacteriota bacterium]